MLFFPWYEERIRDMETMNSERTRFGMKQFGVIGVETSNGGDERDWLWQVSPKHEQILQPRSATIAQLHISYLKAVHWRYITVKTKPSFRELLYLFCDL